MSDIIDRYKSGERDFTQENLFRENLAGVVLTGSVLVEANCCEANFEKADLSYCDLRRVNLTATVTAQLECAEGLLYDIQVVNADGTVDTLTTSTATVAADVTRAVS